MNRTHHEPSSNRNDNGGPALSGFAPRQSRQTAETGSLERWDIAPAGSRLGFVLRHLIVHQIPGQFRRWGGTIYLDRAQPALSSVEAWADLASIDTDSFERDQHLRSPEFLDVERHPRAEFDSTSLEARDGRLVVRGLLRLHGITRDLELEIARVDEEENLYEVRGTLDRQAFGLRWNQDLDVGGVVVGDEIQLTARVKLTRV